METRKEGWHSSRISTFVESCNCEETMKNHTQMYRSWVYYSCVHKRQYYCNDEPHCACPLPADAQPFKHVTQPAYLTTIIHVTSPAPTSLLSPPISLPKTLHWFCEAITKQKPSSHISTFAEMGVYIKGKAVPLQAWSGPEGSRKLRFPEFMTMAQDCGKVVSLTHRPPLPPGNTPGTHFC